MDKLNVDNTILLYAVRYAMKRSIGAPGEVAKAIGENLYEISNDTLKRIQDDIEKNMETFDAPSKFIWQQVREDVAKERISRSRMGNNTNK